MSGDQHAGKITTERKVINPLSEWSSSHVWDIPLRRQNFIHEELKSRLKSGNASNHSVQSLLFSSMLSRNIKIKIYRNANLSGVLYGMRFGLSA
jgi:hypothetical protein